MDNSEYNKVVKWLGKGNAIIKKPVKHAKIKQLSKVSRYARYVAYMYKSGNGIAEPYFKIINEFVLRNYSRDLDIRVLDVGCGVGRILYDLSYLYKNAKLIGVDIDEESLNIAEKVLKSAGEIKIEGDPGDEEIIIQGLRSNNVLLFKCDLNKITKPNIKFNLVVLSMITDRILDYKKLIEWICDSVVIGGYIILTTPESGYYTTKDPKSELLTIHKILRTKGYIVSEILNKIPVFQPYDNALSGAFWNTTLIVAQRT